MNESVIGTATAWDSIGFDDGLFRVKGGRASWQAVMYNCANDGRLVKLARLECGREFSRYVEPDTVLEFLSLCTPIAQLPGLLPERLNGTNENAGQA